jgi:predicted nucleic acid-binding protein
MKYLLDVNALIAFGHNNHEFHDRVALWTERISPEVFTCSITELGLVRILSQVPQYDQTVAQARTLLLMLKSSTTLPLQFLADAHDISRLPAWVSGPNQTTEGHLAELARAHGALLATLDTGIPDAYLIR